MLTRVKEYGSEFDWNANDNFLTEKAQMVLDNAVYYRSGRDALKEVAQLNNKTYKNVLLPALCCSSMVLPFIMNGYEAIFYRLKDGYTADVEDIRNKLKDRTVVLYINYFGIEALTFAELNSLKTDYPNTVFVEDRTHDIINRCRNMSFIPDFTIASIRKWIAIPDAGILTSNNSVKSKPAEYSFADIRKAALMHKSEYLYSGDPVVKEKFREELNQASECLDESNSPYGITQLSSLIFRGKKMHL